VSFAAIILCVASQRVFIIIVVYFVINSVRKLLDTPTSALVRLLLHVQQFCSMLKKAEDFFGFKFCYG
jgi:hypothetical protein